MCLYGVCSSILTYPKLSIGQNLPNFENINNVHRYVKLGCLHEMVASLPMQITLGQNHITKTYNFFIHSYSNHSIIIFTLFMIV